VKPYSVLYAVDPSTVATGIAIFTYAELLDVVLLQSNGGVVDMIREIQRFFGSHGVNVQRSYACVVETPVAYPFGGRGADPNDLIQVAVVAGAVRAHFSTSTAVTPRQWNGGVPKKITAKRIRALLTPKQIAMVEAVPYGVRHNVWDAIGIGMYHLKATGAGT